MTSREHTRHDPSSSRFQIFSIGGAVASRNIHAAVYDAQRLCQPV